MLSKIRNINKQGNYGYTVRIPPDFIEWLGIKDKEQVEILLNQTKNQLIIKKYEQK